MLYVQNLLNMKFLIDIGHGKQIFYNNLSRYTTHFYSICYREIFKSVSIDFFFFSLYKFYLDLV